MQLPGMHIKISDLLDLNSHCNVYCYDLNHCVIAMNDQQMEFMQQYGYKDKAEIINKFSLLDYPEFIHAKHENDLVIQTGKTHQFFNKVSFKDKFLLLVTIKTPTYDDSGKINGVFGISQIISVNTVKKNEHMKLTDRQHQCISLLLQGKTNNQVAEALKLSPRTIESYIENIKNKLGCNSKSMLIEKILDLGLVNFELESISTDFQPGIFIQPDVKKDK